MILRAFISGQIYALLYPNTLTVENLYDNPESNIKIRKDLYSYIVLKNSVWLTINNFTETDTVYIPDIQNKLYDDLSDDLHKFDNKTVYLVTDEKIYRLPITKSDSLSVKPKIMDCYYSIKNGDYLCLLLELIKHAENFDEFVHGISITDNNNKDLIIDKLIDFAKNYDMFYLLIKLTNDFGRLPIKYVGNIKDHTFKKIFELSILYVE